MGRSLLAQGAASLRAEPWDQGGAVLSPVGATVCTAAPTGLCRRDTAFPGLAEAAAPWATNEQPYGLGRKVLLPHEVSGSIRLTISWSTYKRDMHPRSLNELFFGLTLGRESLNLFSSVGGVRRYGPPFECFALVAQLAEQMTLNHRVEGSSPSRRSSPRNVAGRCCRLRQSASRPDFPAFPAPSRRPLSVQ